jgi:hypothetical protein
MVYVPQAGVAAMPLSIRPRGITRFMTSIPSFA